MIWSFTFAILYETWDDFRNNRSTIAWLTSYSSGMVPDLGDFRNPMYHDINYQWVSIATSVVFWKTMITNSFIGHHHCVLPLVAGELKPFFWRAVLVCLVLGCFGVVVTSFSAMLLSWSMMFWMLVAVVLSLFGLSENISLLYTLYSPTRCRTSQSSRTCFWVSTGSPHALQVWFRYLFL